MTLKKKVPMRMCVGCNEMKPKKEIVRIVKAQDNTISIDATGKKSGRGAYICYNIECLEKARKGKKLEKAFQQAIKPEIYDALREEFVNNNDQ